MIGMGLRLWRAGFGVMGDHSIAISSVVGETEAAYETTGGAMVVASPAAIARLMEV